MTQLIELKKKFHSGAISKADYIESMHESHRKLFEYAEFMRGSSIEKIELTDGQVTMTVRGSGIKIVCDPADRRIAPIDALNFGAYEQAEAEMMLSLIDEGQTVFDIGANIGWYSLLIAKHFGSVRVLAFEPIPKTYQYLRRHLDLNTVTDQRVRSFNFGFSQKEENLTFYFYPEGSVNASAANLKGGEGVQEITCHVVRLDDFVAKENVSPDFIKCDVEGAELLVFNGAHETLRSSKPLIFTEMLRKWSAKFHYHPNEIIEMMRHLGYRCFTIHGSRLREFVSMNESTIETNFFFLHVEKHREKIARFSESR